MVGADIIKGLTAMLAAFMTVAIFTGPKQQDYKQN